MKKTERIIGNLLKKDMHKIEDESFTERIITLHLSKQKISGSRPFPDFNLLIIGISLVIISIGLILSLKIKITIFKDLVFTEQHGLILLLISLIFLIFIWLDCFIAQKKE